MRQGKHDANFTYIMILSSVKRELGDVNCNWFTKTFHWNDIEKFCAFYSLFALTLI